MEKSEEADDVFPNADHKWLTEGQHVTIGNMFDTCDGEGDGHWFAMQNNNNDYNIKVIQSAI